MGTPTYRHADEIAGSDQAARIIIPQILRIIGGVRSVVDLGGGGGAWLRVFQELGASEILLIDSPAVESHLVIPRSCFLPVNLMAAMPRPTRFDLAVCVECAEHLLPRRARPLVEWLTSASDRVVFSAAIPGQGGKGHLNEQLPDYWVDLFREQGFLRHDVLRRGLLSNPAIPWWYRQNLFLFSKPDVQIFAEEGDFLPEEWHLVNRIVTSHQLPFYVTTAMRRLAKSLLLSFKRMTSSVRAN